MWRKMEDWKKEFIEKMFPINNKDIDLEQALVIKKRNLPSLFKYTKIDEKRLKSLSEDAIWFEKPENFNDPYDSFLNINKKELLLNIQNHMGNWYNVEFKKLQDRLKREHNKSDAELETMMKAYQEAVCSVLEKNMPDIHDHSQKGLFVSCFSELKNSILMWSHYGDNHKGICLEYDFLNSKNDEIFFKSIFPVVYSRELLDLTKYHTVEMKEFNNLIVVLAAIFKSQDWFYEKEWRTVFPLGPDSKAFCRSGARTKAIYLGTKISKANKKLLVEIARGKNILIYQMVMKKDRYELIEEIIN